MHKGHPIQNSGISAKANGSNNHKPDRVADLTVRGIDEASAQAAYATVVLAFTGDPAARWSWPHAEDFLRNMPKLARAFSEKSFGLGTAYGIDGLAGVALWLPPGTSSDEEALTNLFQSTTHPSTHKDSAVVFEKMSTFHPREAHWYLPLIGVDPARQGERLGDKLMYHALLLCDEDGLPAYLESSNPRNIPFYERHGFEALGKIQAGSSPTIVPMLRRPRKKKHD
jgi:ribosomal protein S18 acetylase RimI-like enzyme